MPNYGELAKQFVIETYGPLKDYPGEHGQEAWLSWLGQAALVLEWYVVQPVKPERL